MFSMSAMMILDAWRVLVSELRFDHFMNENFIDFISAECFTYLDAQVVHWTEAMKSITLYEIDTADGYKRAGHFYPDDYCWGFDILF